jgi:Flp pilus assembly protein TadD
MHLKTNGKLVEYKSIAEKQRFSLSCCIIARDEEESIAEAIGSVRDLADEVIVVDTGSTDRTRCFAASCGARVYEAPWSGDFSEARNIALSRAQRSWILVLDADESLEPLGRDRLRRLLWAHPNSALTLEQRSYTWCSSGYGLLPSRGCDGRGAPGYFKSEQVRIFPNSDTLRYRGRVHESIEDSLVEAGVPIVRTGHVIHHYGRLEASYRLHRKCSAYLAGPREGIPVHSGDARYIYELSAVLFESGEFDEALAHAARGSSLEPDNWEFLNVQGMAHLQKGNLHDAEGCFGRALQLAGSNPDLCNNLGVVLVQQNRERHALRFFEEGIAMCGGNGNVSRNAASACLTLGMLDEALVHVSRSLEMDPFMPQTHVVHAEVLLARGDIPGASRALENMRFLPGTSLKVCLKAVQLFIRMGMIDRAEEMLSRSQRDYPGHEGLLYLSAKICESKGDHERALSAYRSLAVRSPESADIRNSLGCLYEKLGRFERSLECFREAKRLAPDNACIDMNIGIVEGRLGLTVEAERHLRDAVAKDEGSGASFNALGCHLANQGRFEEAVRCFDSAVRLEPSNSAYHMNLANACGRIHPGGAAAGVCRGAGGLDTRSRPAAVHGEVQGSAQPAGPAPLPDFDKP